MRSTSIQLTRRETEILRLVAEGHSDREVAKILWVTNQTIKFHLQNVYKKLNVRDRVEAIRWFKAHRPDDDPDGEPGSGVRVPRRPINPSQAGSGWVEPAEAV